MSDELSSSHGDPTTLSQPWHEVWIQAFTQPTVESYERIVSGPQVSAFRAYLWVFLSYVIGSAISMLGITIFGGLSSLLGEQGMGPSTGLGITGLTLLCVVPFGALIGVVILIFLAGISNAIARALGGTGNFTQLSYAFAAYIAPLTLVGSIIGMVPILNCLTLPFGFYGLFLNILAIKSVHRFSWGKAVLSSVVVIAGIFIFIAVVVIVILALLGPAIGNVFSNIIEEIATPVP